MNSTINKLTTGKIIGLVVLGVLIIGTLWSFSTYNSLVSLNENIKQAESDIEVQYQRRFELIPNLVKTVEGIANQEKAVFTALAEARTRYAGTTQGTPDHEQAINQVESSLGRLLVITENYPQLRSSESFSKLQDQLEGTENRISVSRTRFNEVVTPYNKKIRTFPSVLVARLFGFTENNRYKSVEAAATAPVVDFDIK